MKNEVIDCIHTRRSTRDFEDKKISKETAEEIIKAGTMAPSAMNKQPWNFSVVSGRENIKSIAETALKKFNEMGVGDFKGYKLKSADQIFYNAPLVIFVSGKKDWMFLKDDINLCVENMFLAAHSMGIGSCWIGFGLPLNSDPKIKKELGIPEDHDIVAPLIFGYPKKINKTIPERKLNILKWIE